MIKFPNTYADWHSVRKRNVLPNPYTCVHDYVLVFPRLMEITL